MIYRTSHQNFKVQFQVHSRTGFPLILFGSKQEDEEKSASLQPGFEYEIKLDPYGQLSTEDFTALPFEKRQCKLSHELHDKATHPIYTSANCKYDCYINLHTRASVKESKGYPPPEKFSIDIPPLHEEYSLAKYSPPLENFRPILPPE